MKPSIPRIVTALAVFLGYVWAIEWTRYWWGMPLFLSETVGYVGAFALAVVIAAPKEKP